MESHVAVRVNIFTYTLHWQCAQHLYILYRRHISTWIPSRNYKLHCVKSCACLCLLRWPRGTWTMTIFNRFFIATAHMLYTFHKNSCTLDIIINHQLSFFHTQWFLLINVYGWFNLLVDATFSPMQLSQFQHLLQTFESPLSTAHQWPSHGRPLLLIQQLQLHRTDLLSVKLSLVSMIVLPLQLQPHTHLLDWRNITTTHVQLWLLVHMVVSQMKQWYHLQHLKEVQYSICVSTCFIPYSAKFSRV